MVAMPFDHPHFPLLSLVSLFVRRLTHVVSTNLRTGNVKPTDHKEVLRRGDSLKMCVWWLREEASETVQAI
jgi:hypothetical protein